MDHISFEQTTLPNGLDVIFHEDHSLPLVAVNVWYHVGSKDEEPGKTGFAHLFEHIMFEGSKHHNRSHFDSLQKVGANLNGSTNMDRTNYWEDLPSNYLDLALWLEADRMGFLLDALNQRRFDIQRDVVKNERRQSYENRPYGIASLRLQGAAYPMPHPYHWPTIGFHEDLDAASLDDVRAFFQRFYHPSNASLAIAGDFDTDAARASVERYFGDLSPGPALPRARRTDSPLQGYTNLTLYDRVLLPRVYLTWPTVPRFHPDEAPLAALASVLGDGKTSRLHQALVYDRQIAQSAGAFHGAAEIAGDFELEVTAASGHTAAEVEEAAREEIERLRSDTPTPEEMERVRNRLEWRHVRQMVTIGGFGGKANRLNSYNVYAGDVGLVDRDLERFLAVQPEDVQRVARTYLTERHVHLTVLPEPVRSHSAVSIDRSAEPPPTAPRPFVPPTPQQDRLSNGLNLLVIEKRGTPLVALSLLIGSGGEGDPSTYPGLAAFTTAMLQEGTANRSSQQIADEFESMGRQLTLATTREYAILGTEALTRQWPKALEMVADLARNPTFPEEELARVRRQRLTSLRRLRDDATSLADRVAPMLLYGPESAYGHPMMGTEAVLEALSQDDLANHFRGTFAPDNATLVVVGDTSREDVRKLAEEHFGDWSRNGSSTHAFADGDGSPPPPTTTIYVLDKPGAAQSVIRAGHVGAPRKHPDYFPLAILNHVFGGQFTARLNMNLRQDKGYSYGYRSWIEWRRRSSLVMAGGGVQTDVTREAVEETLREFHDIREGRPVTAEEFEAAKTSLLRQFPASFETPSQIMERLVRIASFDLPLDYDRTYAANIEVVSLDDVRRTGREHIMSDRLTLLVTGDQASIEAGLRDLGHPVHIVDHEGRES